MNNAQITSDWNLYLDLSRRGEIPNLYSLGIKVGKPQFAHFAPSFGQERAESPEVVVQRLVNFWNEVVQAMDGEEEKSDEQKIFELGLRMLEDARWGHVAEVKQALDLGVPVNFQDPRIRFTALHHAVTTDGRNRHQLLDFLLDYGLEIDFLLEDFEGRKAWDSAIIFNFPADKREALRQKTKAQGLAEGRDIDEEFKDNFKNRWSKSRWFSLVSQTMRFIPEGP